MARLLTELRDRKTRRSKSAHRIAEYVTLNAAAVTKMPIAALAAAVGVSEPTVNRFCTGLGMRGFPDFKLTLAEELARRQFPIAQGISSSDTSSAVLAKVFEAAHASLQATLHALQPASIDATVQALGNARSISICGQGASSSVAMDAQHKLLRFDVPVVAHLDNLNQRMCAAGLSKHDCLICISYTGRTIPIIEIAKIGRSAGAVVIGITSNTSALAKLCDHVLCIDSHEDTDIYMPMSSRLSQLAVIDVITACLSMRQADSFPAHFQRLKQSVRTTRTTKDQSARK